MQFSHELIRQALLHAISLPRRQQLHMKAAAAWKDEPDSSARSASLASHLYLADSLVDVGDAIAFCTKAGDESMQVFAYGDAAKFFGMAIDVWMRRNSASSQTDLARLRARRGEALFLLARHRDARPDFEMAAEMLPPEERVEMLVPLALASIWSEDMETARAVASEADSLIEEFKREDSQACRRGPPSLLRD